MGNKEVVTRVYQTIPMRKGKSLPWLHAFPITNFGWPSVATPDDVANAIAYLASDKAAGHVSGEIIEVTGMIECTTG